MAELTVGYVAGFIALGIFIGEFADLKEQPLRHLEQTLANGKFTAHVLTPTLLTFVLAGILRDKETAATWYNFRLCNEAILLTSFKDRCGSRPAKLILVRDPSIGFFFVAWRPEEGASNNKYHHIHRSPGCYCRRGDTSRTLRHAGAFRQCNTVICVCE